MSNYCMNNRSQGMRQTYPAQYNKSNTMPAEGCGAKTNCSCTSSMDCPAKADTQHIHWGDLPIAMGYVPFQKYCSIFDLKKGLSVGTIFPELYKPFRGKGGGC